jgi:hypothetical protein
MRRHFMHARRFASIAPDEKGDEKGDRRVFRVRKALCYKHMQIRLGDLSAKTKLRLSPFLKTRLSPFYERGYGLDLAPEMRQLIQMERIRTVR